ncbi:MAG TPA: cyanophycin synthetase [Candidatus Limnocylindrales bacterium]
MTRSAADVGAGLAPARPARPIAPGERIHVVGIAGAGASAAALLARAAGAIVDGCDPGAPSQYTPALESAGIAIAASHDPAHVTPDLDRLAVTKALTAINPDHPELVAARGHGVAVEAWQQVVADAASGKRLVAVAGTHGKSTTSGWLVHALGVAGRDPSAFVGALLPAVQGAPPSTARSGWGDDFVVEADEYAGNFDPYRPDVAILTSVEWDHPDVFADVDAVLDAFERWLRAATAGGRRTTLVANVSDRGVDRLVRERLADWAGLVVRVSIDDETTSAAIRARVVAEEPAGTTIELTGLDDADGDVPRTARLPTAGRHNVANAVCVAGAARVLGIPGAAIVAGLETFPGIGRRLERKGEAGGVVVYDDYGHHPSAIRATLAALRQREPGRHVWAAYEPLTYHRTAALLEEFAAVLATADGVAVADIWAGRDPDTSIASAEKLADAVRARRPGLAVGAPGSPEMTADWLARRVRPGDAVLVMGGGRSYRIGEILLELLGGAA